MSFFPCQRASVLALGDPLSIPAEFGTYNTVSESEADSCCTYRSWAESEQIYESVAQYKQSPSQTSLLYMHSLAEHEKWCDLWIEFIRRNLLRSNSTALGRNEDKSEPCAGFSGMCPIMGHRKRPTWQSAYRELCPLIEEKQDRFSERAIVMSTADWLQLGCWL